MSNQGGLIFMDVIRTTLIADNIKFKETFVKWLRFSGNCL